ncbi:hypothetical protein ACHAXA_004629 [Cyclostephanos tholiformis]|uniref:ATP-dependent RNA helicase n=1 Tax=Cyclostephanos tholiformis TaxID=382380 RepID=A0ABD3SNY6_9STRA
MATLEVIPGDAYMVEKTGDDVSGYVTRVIYKDGNKMSPSSDSTIDIDDGRRSKEEKTGTVNEGTGRKVEEGTNGSSKKAAVASMAAGGGETTTTTTTTTTKKEHIDPPPRDIGTSGHRGRRSHGQRQDLELRLTDIAEALGGAGRKTTRPTRMKTRRRDGGGGLREEYRNRRDHVLRALILTPTRELAMQVASELTRVCQGGDERRTIVIGTIVGGFAEAKQRRILEKDRPSVLVATPGRLWEMMSSKEYTHLNDLSQLSFLVIDEADRMIKQGSFPQLKQIFDREREGGGEIRGRDIPAPVEMDDEDYERQLRRSLHDVEDAANEEEAKERVVVHRQTFVYSATLTLPPSMHHLIKKDLAAKIKTKRRKGNSRQPTTVDGAIAEILEIAGARGETKIVDLSNAGEGTLKKKNDVENESKVAFPLKSSVGRGDDGPSSSLLTRLPPGLTLGEIRCAQKHKDSHLYAYLVTTRQGSSGPCLVFCNSIAAVRRVGETLKTLGLPVRMLHAQMAQKARLNALESLRTSSTRSIVVASDVAARGLDIQAVTTVIHYDVARVVDTFIHRAGRTAVGLLYDNANCNVFVVD